MIQKQCKKCREEKDINLFPKNKSKGKYFYRGKCAQCYWAEQTIKRREYRHKRYQEKRLEWKIWLKEYRKTEKGRAVQLASAYTEMAKHPDRYRARKYISHKIEAHTMEKPTKCSYPSSKHHVLADNIRRAKEKYQLTK